MVWLSPKFNFDQTDVLNIHYFCLNNNVYLCSNSFGWPVFLSYFPYEIKKWSVTWICMNNKNEKNTLWLGWSLSLILFEAFYDDLSMICSCFNRAFQKLFQNQLFHSIDLNKCQISCAEQVQTSKRSLAFCIERAIAYKRKDIDQNNFKSLSPCLVLILKLI